MQKTKNAIRYFSTGEIALWGASVALIALSFCAFDGEKYMTLLASVIGVTSLIFNAKGNPMGQLLMVVFSLLYGAISWSFRYYGEMITYLGMTMPMAVIALVSWLRNPYDGNRAEVAVNHLRAGEWAVMALITVPVTAAFGLMLRALGTANLVPSTVSVLTSFVAAYLTFRRSPYFALAYAMNDVVLVVLWLLASAKDVRYVAVVVCFAAFLLGDMYGFLSWRRMGKRQATALHGASDR